MIELLAGTLDKIFTDHDRDDPRGQVWEHLHEHGLLWPFQQGLSRWSEAGALVRTASLHAPGLPFAEQVLASFFHAGCELSAELPHVSLADAAASELVLSGNQVSGYARLVPHAAVSTHLWLETESAPGRHDLLLVEVRGAEATAGRNLAGEPRHTLVLRAAPVVARRSGLGSRGPLGWLGALLRATQMAALSQAVLAMTLEHARTRQQFGAPVASFQAVQQQLALLGCEVAALHCAVLAAEAAVDACEPLVFEPAGEAVAAAKIQAGTTAKVAVEVGHAVHAAIGFTREHRLHRYTQRLLSYRAEFGAERIFSAWLGERAAASGYDRLWEQLLGSAV